MKIRTNQLVQPIGSGFGQMKKSHMAEKNFLPKP